MQSYTDTDCDEHYGRLVIGWIVYIAIAVAAWPVLAFFLLRMGTIQTQYRQLGLAAGLALLWPVTLALTVAGRVVRSTRTGAAGAAVSQASTRV